MKNLWTCIILLMIASPHYQQEKKANTFTLSLPTVKNLFIITTDGFRWQEVFNGADSALINDERYTPDAETINALYWASTAEERRKKLMPFFWNVLAKQGQVYGNRQFDNKVNVANAYSISYSGYNEIFTGNTDISVSSNAKDPNDNINVLELLNAQKGFSGKVAAFTSWDVFPYILNRKRNNLLLNSGYEKYNDTDATYQQQLINKVENEDITEKSATRYDELTFLNTKEYVMKNRPRVLFLGLGETDEFAHKGRYDLYLEQATKVDQMIAELWHWVQTTPGYKDNTAFIITTDHGRGSKKNKWTDHGMFVKNSSQTWLAIIGPGIKHIGELKDEEQLYEVQVAATISELLGESFADQRSIAQSISLK